jgi:hypothetical protein
MSRREFLIDWQAKQTGTSPRGVEVTREALSSLVRGSESRSIF